MQGSSIGKKEDKIDVSKESLGLRLAYPSTDKLWK
jgi:hypothetical protein